MPSPTKITTTDLLNSRTPSPNNEQINKKQLHVMSSATNYGFLRESTPPPADNFGKVKENQRSPVSEAEIKPSHMSKFNEKEAPASECVVDIHQEHNPNSKVGQEVPDNNYNTAEDGLSDFLPVVYENREFKFDKRDKSVEKLEREGLLNNRECLKLQDLRIHENPLVNAPVGPSSKGTSTPDSAKVMYSKMKAPTSPSKRRIKPSWFRSTTPLEKYLTSSLIILILFFSLIFLSLYSRSDCVGQEKKICLTQECVRTVMEILPKLSYRYKQIYASSLLAAMDLTANPCQDFFQFACGTWNKKHIIPEDKSSISTFEVMADQLQVILKGVLEEPYDEDDKNSATMKAKLFYKSCMNLERIRKIGDAPLREILESLGGWPVATPDWEPPPFSIETLLGRIRGEYNEGVLVEPWVGPDDKNSSVHILQVDQMQLALPSRDYYLKSSSQAELKAYHNYMTQVAVLLGANVSEAEVELEKVVEFEKELANVTLAEADRHDTSLIYRKLPLTKLQEEVPQLNWKEYLSTFVVTKLDDNEPIVSYAMPYLTEMGQILNRTERRVIHNYVIWRLIMNLMPHMIDEYKQKTTEFRKILLGILSERHNRWSQCVEWTNKKLGMAVGALFIRENFNHESKETALEMIHTIREAFNELLAENVWMDDETRAVAKEKADAMNERIGYPELLTNEEELNKEYMNLTITEDQFLINVLNVLKYDADHNLKKLRQPVNKDKWSTEPAVVNAFYNPNKNDIVLPAGILQPLFYSQHFPKSLNYGGIGVVIGHEITHGFDDKGRQFDKDGNMMQWWNNATIRAFRERTQCIIDQYSRYKIDAIDLYVNGRMTQGENIADNGGLKQSFRAYKKWVAKHGEEPLLPGINLNHDQLFFLNYAQIWCGSMRPEDALTKIRSSVHSPGPIRVLGPLSNSLDFAKAYNCPPKSPMNPTSKCSVW